MKKEKILEEAQKRFHHCQDWESAARVRMMSDLRFGQGDSTNMYQWPEQIANGRRSTDKPCLTMNRVRQYCLNIINDAREHKAEIRVNPVGNGASYKSAQILEGVVRHIGYISNADQAYDAASFNQVYMGLGWWRVITDYADGDGFDQEIYIKRVADAMSVYLDPSITEYDGSDARYGFVFRDLDRDVFEAEYPKYKDVASSQSPLHEDHSSTNWINQDQVRVCEYYRKVEEDDTLYYLETGETVRESEVEDPELRKQLKEMAVKSRSVSKNKIMWHLIVGNEIVETTEWPGKYIPLVRVVGEETVIDGQLDRKGHVRNLLDVQRAYNYYTSAGIEFVALQTKSPYIAPITAIEGYEKEWREANTVNLSVLPYNHLDDAGNEIPRPAREQPPVYANAYLEGMKIAQNEMAMVSGQFEAVLGQPSNERSGSAINARQRAALNSTYHFVDHLSRAIKFTGKILIDLIPKIYDTERVIKILAQDGTQQTVQVNPNAPQAHQEVQGLDDESIDPNQIAAIFNPSVGLYDVEADVGPAFATKRQEAFNALSDIMAQNESLAPMVMDLWAKNSDFPDSDVIAERFRRMLPPQASGKVDPQVQQLQNMLAQQHQIMGQMGQKLKENELKESLEKKNEELEWYKAETDRLKAVGSIDQDALKPIVRQLVSEVLGTPANPIIAAHMRHDADVMNSMQPPEQNTGGDNG